MKSWLGSYYETSGSEPVDASVLISEKIITIGIRRGANKEVFTWNITDTQAVYDQGQQLTRLANTRTHSKLEIESKEPMTFIEQLRRKVASPGIEKTGQKNGRETLLSSLA